MTPRYPRRRTSGSRQHRTAPIRRRGTPSSGWRRRRFAHRRAGTPSPGTYPPAVHAHHHTRSHPSTRRPWTSLYRGSAVAVGAALSTRRVASAADGILGAVSIEPGDDSVRLRAVPDARPAAPTPTSARAVRADARQRDQPPSRQTGVAAADVVEQPARRGPARRSPTTPADRTRRRRRRAAILAHPIASGTSPSGCTPR
jgi:hypothetical protein